MWFKSNFTAKFIKQLYIKVSFTIDSMACLPYKIFVINLLVSASVKLCLWASFLLHPYIQEDYNEFKAYCRFVPTWYILKNVYINAVIYKLQLLVVFKNLFLKLKNSVSFWHNFYQRMLKIYKVRGLIYVYKNWQWTYDDIYIA